MLYNSILWAALGPWYHYHMVFDLKKNQLGISPIYTDSPYLNGKRWFVCGVCSHEHTDATEDRFKLSTHDISNPVDTVIFFRLATYNVITETSESIFKSYEVIYAKILIAHPIWDASNWRVLLSLDHKQDDSRDKIYQNYLHFLSFINIEMLAWIVWILHRGRQGGVNPA